MKLGLYAVDDQGKAGMALIAVYLSVFHDWSEYLADGERGTLMVIAGDRKQARSIMRFCLGLLKCPMLRPLVEREQRGEIIDLSNRISIEIHTCSFRSVRGYTCVAALLDELAFWPQEESTCPDTEVIAAIKPSMATVPGAMLICASSPYGRRGALWDNYRQHFGKADSNKLVWQAPTRVMNSTISKEWIDEQIEANPARNTSEYLAEFRADLEAFILPEAVQACVTAGVQERPRLRNTRYQGFIDAAGGSGRDSMTMAIAHRQRDGIVVIDAVREVRPYFSPEHVVSEFAALLHSYQVTRVENDRYGGEWVAEQFRKHGIKCEPTRRAGPGRLNNFSASISGASAGVRLPSGGAAG